MKYLVLLLILLLIPVASAQVLVVDGSAVQEVTAKQYELTRFVFGNSPNSKTLHLQISDGLLKEKGTFEYSKSIDILPGDVKVIEAIFETPGVHEIVNVADKTTVLARITVVKKQSIYAKLFQTFA